MTEIVTYAVQGHLGVITLSNPPVNALSQSKGVLQRILDAIKEGEHDSAVKAFLVIGSGRAFQRWRGHLRVRIAAGNRDGQASRRSPTTWTR